MNRDDVGVGERAGRPKFPLESGLKPRAVLPGRHLNNLDRDLLADHGVLGQIDEPHGSLAEELFYLVAAKILQLAHVSNQW